MPRLHFKTQEALPKRLTWLLTGLGGRARYFIALMRRLRVDRRYNLIYCGHINLLPAAMVAKFVTGAPLILQIHGIDAWQATRHRLTNRLAGRVDWCLAVSRITRRRFLAWSALDAHRCLVLPNTIPDGIFSPGPKNPQLLERYNLHGKKILMTLGRLESKERYKGFDEMLDALPALLAHVPDLAYCIVGDGNDRARLEEKVASLGLTHRVVFTGNIAEPEKADHYRLADVYVMPSRGEGFGIVFLEAMAVGIPAIGSREDGGQDPLLDGESGRLVNPANSAEVIESVLWALQKTGKTIPVSAARFNLFRFQRRLNALIDLSLQTMARSHGP